ncbi:hypothetical protein EK21DRAFT_83863 [Setomelanomma holmii]|uniref:Uncharacterized protein n=1 Tax=Setomelanomma holmii TaxID=210430 RepID=A0A9P4LS92_9PLEO|nr:hypothetical protein EK21DRAFT_83863 [Setomelanomma holmii]
MSPTKQFLPRRTTKEQKPSQQVGMLTGLRLTHTTFWSANSLVNYSVHQKISSACGEQAGKPSEGHPGVLNERNDIRAIIISDEGSGDALTALGSVARIIVGTETVDILKEIHSSEVVAHGTAIWARQTVKEPWRYSHSKKVYLPPQQPTQPTPTYNRLLEAPPVEQKHGEL